jgi:hypothetical protein
VIPDAEASLGLLALDVLRITARSKHNRAALLQLGMLPYLTRVMKVRQRAFPCCPCTLPMSCACQFCRMAYHSLLPSVFKDYLLSIYTSLPQDLLSCMKA